MDKSKLILGVILKTIGATGTIAVDHKSRGMVPRKKPSNGCTPCAAVARAAAMNNAATKRFAPKG